MYWKFKEKKGAKKDVHCVLYECKEEVESFMGSALWKLCEIWTLSLTQPKLYLI